MSRQTIRKWAVAAAAFILAAIMSGFAQAQQSQQQPPAEYYQLMGQANYAFKHANNKADYEEAVKFFQQAVNAAPWLPDTYYDLGKAQQNAEQFNDAINSLQRYLQLKPDANDRDKVNAEIEELQGEAKQAAAQPAIEQQNQQQTQQQSDADFIASLNGARYESSFMLNGLGRYDQWTIRGDQLIEDQYTRNWILGAEYARQIKGRTVEDPLTPNACTRDFGTTDCKYVWTIHKDYIEGVLYVGSTALPDGFTDATGSTHQRDIYKRVQ